MRMGIVGSREFADRDWLSDEMVNWYKILRHDFPTLSLGFTVVSGGAEGTDTLAQQAAKLANLDFIEFLPYFKCDKSARYSAIHFFIRNQQIVDNVDALLVFWDGESRGTASAIKMAEKKGIPIKVVRYNEQE